MLGTDPDGLEHDEGLLFISITSASCRPEVETDKGEEGKGSG